MSELLKHCVRATKTGVSMNFVDQVNHEIEYMKAEGYTREDLHKEREEAMILLSSSNGTIIVRFNAKARLRAANTLLNTEQQFDFDDLKLLYESKSPRRLCEIQEEEA